MSCCPGPKTGPEFDPSCEGPSQADIDRFGAADRPCPECGEDVYADAPFCHSCGAAIEDEMKRHGARKTVFAIGGALALAGFLFMAL